MKIYEITRDRQDALFGIHNLAIDIKPGTTEKFIRLKDVKKYLKQTKKGKKSNAKF